MKTDLGKVFTVSGEQGLFTYVAQAARGAILESMITKKRMVAGPSAKMSALTDISIYTAAEEAKLQEVFLAMKENLGDDAAPSGKQAPEVYKEFFDKAFPDYDPSRFYPSHMKKVCDWYNCLKTYASLDFTTEEESDGQVDKGEVKNAPKKDGTAKAKAAAAKAGVKNSAKQSAPAKSNVPRKVI